MCQPNQLRGPTNRATAASVAPVKRTDRGDASERLIDVMKPLQQCAEARDGTQERSLRTRLTFQRQSLLAFQSSS
jgi:hypothetical protein